MGYSERDSIYYFENYICGWGLTLFRERRRTKKAMVIVNGADVISFFATPSDIPELLREIRFVHGADIDF